MVIAQSDENGIYISIRLNIFHSWWKRVCKVTLYILGRDIPCGMYDEFLLSIDDIDKLKKIVEYLEKQKLQEEQAKTNAI